MIFSETCTHFSGSCSGRVEEGRGGLSLRQSLRFPSPVELDDLRPGELVEAITRERVRRPAPTRGNESNLFVKFAMDVGGLTNRQAEAMFWTEWFCSVCEGHITYADERA
jgi:hypothetical protein